MENNLPKDTEKSLIEQFLKAKDEVEKLTENLKSATKVRDDIEANIIKNLMDEGKSATAKYEELGYLNLVQGAAHASIQKGMQDDVKAHLRSIGREDLIKETVPAASLSAYVRECLKTNQEIPQGISFYVPQYLTFYPAK